MKKTLVSSIFVGILIACSSPTSTPEEKVVISEKSYKVKTIDENGVAKEVVWDGKGEMPEELKGIMQSANANDSIQTAASAKILIEGMSCAKMCASSIEKTLSEAPGVSKAAVNFEEKTAVVDFDDQKTNEKTLITLIEGLKEGQYQVKSLEITKEQKRVVAQNN